MDNDEANLAVSYYRKQLEELAGENLKYDHITSGLKHELRKLHRGFSLLSKLQQTFSELTDLTSIFEITLQAINETFSMNKSIILKSVNSNEHLYSPSQWQGFSDQESKNFSSLSLCIPKDFANGENILLVTRSTKPTKLIEEIQNTFNLPFFICLPLIIENVPATLLLSGRLKEVKPFYPPLNQGDVDTIQAVADLIKATIRNRRLSVLKEVDYLKTKFFTNISHEFRTPLTLILGPLEQLMEKNNDYQDRLKYETIYKNAQKLLRLINQLLDLSKLDAGKLNLRAAKGNIVKFVKGTVMSFESMADKKEIRLGFTSSMNDIRLYFDSDKMTKILTNLLSNALKFTGKGGKVTISINTNKNYTEIKVKDTGIGISEGELAKLFDRFYQVDSSHTREYEGTGIGLSLTKELVELHHGKIRVNTEVGKGSEFILELPNGKDHLTEGEITVIPNEKEEKIIIGGMESPSYRSQNIKVKTKDKTVILIVEDNADVREYIKDSLDSNYLTREAINGKQGVSKAIRIVPDLIISDIMMPKMDGNELTRILKNDERTSHIPVILLTAKSEQESKLEGLETGADDYLIKPFDIKELSIRIKNLINSRKKLQQKYSKDDYILNQYKERLSSLDEKFMSKVMEVIESHLTEEVFNIEKFDKELGMGRVQIYRKLKALTGKSPSRFIRTMRLVKAKKMITEKQGNISEIAYSVGFSAPQYFTKCFKQEYGYPPSKLVK